MLKTRPELGDMQLTYADEHRAIHFAVIHRRLEIVRLLMQYGANARAGVHPYRSATTAYTFAQERGYHEIQKISLKIPAKSLVKPKIAHLIESKTLLGAD